MTFNHISMFTFFPGNAIVISDIAIGCMLLFLAGWSYKTSFHSVWSLYFVPWLVSYLLLVFCKCADL